MARPRNVLAKFALFGLKSIFYCYIFKYMAIFNPYG